MRPGIIGLIVFILTCSLTQILTYQRYIIDEETNQTEVLQEINRVKNRLEATLSHSLSATKTLAYIVEEYGVPADFEHVAKNILGSNKYIDALELTSKGVITHVYPLKGNEVVVGYDVLSDSMRYKEALLAVQKKELYFAGPLKLKQGDTAIVGRLPIFKDSTFIGFSVVLVKLKTMLKGAEIDLNKSNFVYQISKENPKTHEQEFFLNNNIEWNKKHSASIEVPAGKWTLYVMSKENNNFLNIIIISVLGLLISAFGGLSAWFMARQPEKLNQLVEEKTSQLLVSEKHFRSLIERSSDAIVLLDIDGKVIYQTPSTDRISGYNLEAIRAIEKGIELIHPNDREADSQMFKLLMQSPGISIKHTHRLKHKSGHYIWIEGTYTNLLQDENVKAIVYNYSDITARKEAEQKAKTAGRLYQLTGSLNQMMVHATDEASLFNEVCDIAVNIGEFSLAWICLVNNDGIEQDSDRLNYFSKIPSVTFDRAMLNKEKRDEVIRTSKYIVCNNIAEDAQNKAWAQHALAAGYHAVMTIPIMKFGKVIGTFSLYTSESNYFDSTEITLLEETTGNISFTLENFEKDRMRKQAEDKMAEERRISESIINSLPGIFYVFDTKGKYLRWNKNHELVSEYSGDEISGMSPLQFFEEDEQPHIRETLDKVMEYGKADVTGMFKTKSGRKIPYYFNGHKFSFDNKDYVIGMGIDISDSVKTEKELKERTAETQRLTSYLERIQEEERTRIAREIHDELGQQLTGLKMDASWISNKIPVTETGICIKLKAMIELIDDTIKTVRRIASELRPGILDDLGLIAALEWLGQEFEKRTGIKINFETNLQEFDNEKEVATNVFRVYQEALTNITRHAKATEVESSLFIKDKNLILTIKDNGIGFDKEEVKKKNSLGMIGMKERALIFNGILQINTEKNKGTTIILNIPFF